MDWITGPLSRERLIEAIAPQSMKGRCKRLPKTEEIP